MTMLIVEMIEARGLRDVEGRPLREGRTPAELLREGDIEYKTCPYSGSRLGKPMNASALRQMGAHWDEACATLASLRAAHDRVLGVTEPGLMDIWRTSQLGSALPWWHHFRGEVVPAHVAALAKATLGQGIWAQRVLVKTMTDGWSPPPLTPASMLELAELSGTLVGETEVCSGGDKMLLRFFDVLVGANAAAPVADELLAFGAHYANFKLLMWIYFLARRFLWADAGVQLDSAVEPSDFFIVEPANLAEVTREQRAGWFRQLADLVVPFAPRSAGQPGGDLALRDHAFMLAHVMGTPLASFAALEAIFASVVTVVETAFSGSAPAAITPAVLDRIVPRRHADLPAAPNATGA
jgi:hypothetical protein